MTYTTFEKLKQRAKTADFFLFIFVILEPFITSSVSIFNVSNKAKAASDRDY